MTAETLAGSAPASPSAGRGRLIVDAPVRMFHGLFALCFAGAWFTAEGEAWRALHITLGYAMAGLLGFRLVYGLVGPRPARLSLLWSKCSSVIRLVSGPRSAAPGRQLQNLAMALTILALLLLLVPLTLTGYLVDNDAPEWLAGLHETLGNAMLAAVLLHLALVALLSVLRRKNLPWQMVSGRVGGNGADLVANRRWLAALLLAGVIGWCAWQWHQAPNGLINWQAATSWQNEHHGDKDGDDD